MYEPRTPKARRPLKGRVAVPIIKPLCPSAVWQSNGWLSLVTLGTTVVPPRVVPRVFTYIKKMLRYPKTSARFWVNAQCAFLVTRKPLNVRMGKGKGAKVRLYSRIGHSTTLAALSALRPGFKRRLRRFVGIRLGRKVALVEPPKSACRVEWAQRHRAQKDFLRVRAEEVKTLLTFVRRPALKAFFGRLFKLAWRKPRLRWRLRWPLLPKVSSRLKARRKKWGSGMRISAYVWAGLASLMGGVRRIKKKNVKIVPLRKFRVLLKKNLKKVFFKGKKLLRGKRIHLFLKRIAKLKAKGLYKALRVGVLKLRSKRNPRAILGAPLRGGAGPLLHTWTTLGLRLRPKGRYPLSKTSSIVNLVRVTSMLEKAALLLYGAAKEPTNSGRVLISASPNLKAEGFEKPSKAATGVNPSGARDLSLHLILQDGVIDLWPSVALRPLAMTLATFHPAIRIV